MNKRIYDEISKFEPFHAKEALDKEVMLEFIKNNDDVLVRDNKIAHMTTSGWVTNKDRNKILMIYHNIYDSWAWVGGHADGDEDLVHVVKKEIEEETGKLEKVLCLPISGDYPKDASLFPDNRHLVSLNHESNTMTFFKADLEKGLIIMNGKSMKVDRPNCVIFHKLR